MVPAGIEPMYFWAVFILLFSIIFVLAEKLKFLGEATQNRAIRFVVAFVFAYFTASSSFATIAIAKVFPSISMLIIAIFVFFIMAGFFIDSGGKMPYFIKYAMYFVVVIGIVFVFSSFLTPQFPEIKNFFDGIELSSGDFAWIVVIILIIVVVGAIMKDKNSESFGKQFLKALKDLFP